MKLTKSKLKEIIREEFEQSLFESWWEDLSAKAKQTYAKLHPDSKYAKGIKKGLKKGAKAAGKAIDWLITDPSDPYGDRKGRRPKGFSGPADRAAWEKEQRRKK